MYYAIWFDQSNIVAETYAFTDNPKWVAEYIFLMTKRLLRVEHGYYEECETIEQVTQVFIDKCGAPKWTTDYEIREHELQIIWSQTRPDYYTIMPTAYLSSFDEIIDYSGGIQVYTLATNISRMREIMNRICKKNGHMASILFEAASRIGQYLYAFGVIEEHLDGLNCGHYEEGEVEIIQKACDETNLDIFQIVDIDSGLGIIEYNEYLNAYEMYDMMWINKEVIS